MTDPYPTRRATPSPALLLAVIRLAMLLGVLMFGAVAWWMRRDAGPPDADSSLETRVRMLATIWIIVSLTGMAGLFVFANRQMTDARRRSTSIVAWALGEGAAIAGGVVFLLAGDPRWYIGGLFVLLASFVVFRGR